MLLPYTEEQGDDPYLRAYGGAFLDRTWGQGAAATIKDPILRPTQQLAEFQQQEPETFARVRGALGPTPFGLYAAGIEAVNWALGDDENKRGGEALSPEQVKVEYGHLGVAFEEPTPRGVVELTAERRKAQMRRDEIINASSLGTLGQIGVSLIGAAVDPLNIAAGFIPVMGEARFAQVAGRIGIPAARVAQGAEAGLAGAVAVEPVTFATSRQLQLDYDMSDALLNVAFGTAFGAGIGGLFGPRTIRDAGGDVLDLSEADIVSSAEARKSAFWAAVGQSADGRPVQIDEIFTLDEALLDAQASKALFGDETPSLTAREEAAVFEEHRASLTSLAEGRTDWEPRNIDERDLPTLYGLREADALEAELPDPVVRVPELATERRIPVREGKTQVADAVQFIRSIGGISDDGGNLKAMGVHKGVPGLISKKGKHPDKVREALVEAGYLPPDPVDAPPVSSIDDVVGIIDNYLRGERTYSRYDEAAVAEQRARQDAVEIEAERRRALDTVDEVLADYADAYKPLSEAEKFRAHELYQQGMEPDDIIERIAFESEPDAPHPAADHVLEEIRNVDDFDAAYGIGRSVPEGRGRGGVASGTEAGVAGRGGEARDAGLDRREADYADDFFGRRLQQADENLEAAGEYEEMLPQLAECISRNG